MRVEPIRVSGNVGCTNGDLRFSAAARGDFTSGSGPFSVATVESTRADPTPGGDCGGHWNHLFEIKSGFGWTRVVGVGLVVYLCICAYRISSSVYNSSGFFSSLSYISGKMRAHAHTHTHTHTHTL